MILDLMAIAKNFNQNSYILFIELSPRLNFDINNVLWVYYDQIVLIIVTIKDQFTNKC